MRVSRTWFTIFLLDSVWFTDLQAWRVPTIEMQAGAHLNSSAFYARILRSDQSTTYVFGNHDLHREYNGRNTEGSNVVDQKWKEWFVPLVSNRKNFIVHASIRLIEQRLRLVTDKVSEMCVGLIGLQQSHIEYAFPYSTVLPWKSFQKTLEQTEHNEGIRERTRIQELLVRALKIQNTSALLRSRPFKGIDYLNRRVSKTLMRSKSLSNPVVVCDMSVI